ncbi:DUF971 family protein [Alteromonadaceae bacterium Bs31]|nr:DUF971 family protein [Alteromonadaceae bacterium Bs31]
MSPVPSKIKLHRKSCILELVFAEEVFHLPAEYLRVHSPSAEVKGHGAGEEVLQLNKENVTITGIEPQGNYAIKLIFSDGHDSGIYAWPYLYQLCSHQQEKWQQYQQKVEQHKASEAEQAEAAITSTVRWVEPE